MTEQEKTEKLNQFMNEILKEQIILSITNEEVLWETFLAPDSNDEDPKLLVRFNHIYHSNAIKALAERKLENYLKTI